ncbi:hypothetical protein BC332_25369 [Capsicum chinense]|nr:hypothetical protein BC332_25369 [Capsicum chinense]
MMTDTVAAAVSPVTITSGDDGVPLDPLLQSNAYTDTETNVRVETVEEGIKMVVQMTESMARKVATPVHKQSRLSKVSEERSSLLLGDWKFEMEVRTNGATIGTVDRDAPSWNGNIPEASDRATGQKDGKPYKLVYLTATLNSWLYGLTHTKNLYSTGVFLDTFSIKFYRL